MDIRRATKDNITAIKNLYWELDQDAVKYQPEHFLLLPRPEDFLMQIIEQENSDFLLCEENGSAIGFALVQIKQAGNISCLKEQKYLYILDFIITATRRSQGFGSKLLEACKQYGKEQQAEFLRLSVFPKNQDGIRFYERNGLSDMMKTMECIL